MRVLSSLFIVCAILPALYSCRSKDTGADADPAPFVRLDKIVAEFPNMPQQRQIAVVDSFAIPFNDYIYMMGASTGNIPASIDSLSNTAAFAMFEPEVEKVFSSTAVLEKELGALDKNMRQKLPALPSYSYFGIVSPYRQQVILVDSVVFVALNHYLGNSHEAYSNMPEYMRATKTASHIPIDIAEAIVSVEYPYQPADNATAIQYFIYEGALLKTASSLTGVTDLSKLLGWTPSQLNDVKAKEGEIWRKMATDNIIYSTDMSLAQRLCAPSPSAQPISADLPGRLGRYIGYRIVENYLAENPDVTVSQLLSPDFYSNPSTLINSGYSPK
ncbi:MAG: hypothetical protein NC221_08830 [Duncaniella sp.]|nr:hypothetical protein [Duncaniella sp.]